MYIEQGKNYCRNIDIKKHTRIIKYMSCVDETKGCCYRCIQPADQKAVLLYLQSKFSQSKQQLAHCRCSQRTHNMRTATIQPAYNVRKMQPAQYEQAVAAVRTLLVSCCCFQHGIGVLLLHSAQYWGADCKDRTLIIT